MSIHTGDVETIVREVMRRLNVPTASVASPSRDRAATLTLSGRLVTQGVLEKQLVGIKQLRVAERTVVTPAAKDYLRACGVDIVRGETGAIAAGGAKATLVVGATASTPAVAEAVRLTAKRGVQVERVADSGLIPAIDELCDQIVRGGRMGVLVARETHVAACLANRRRGVRTAASSDVREVRKIMELLGANLLAVDPTGLSGFALGELMREFGAGRGECRAEWRGRLE